MHLSIIIILIICFDVHGMQDDFGSLYSAYQVLTHADAAVANPSVYYAHYNSKVSQPEEEALITRLKNEGHDRALRILYTCKLYDAVKLGDTYRVLQILQIKDSEKKCFADVNASIEGANRVVHSIRSPAIFNYLFRCGMDIHARGKDGYTPMHVAVSYRLKNIFSLLVEYGADIHARTDEGFTPLHIAVKNHALCVTEELLEKGADQNAQAHDGTTPLHIAAGQKHIAGRSNPFGIAELLLKNGADKNRQDNSGLIPLDLAIQHENWRIVGLLQRSTVLISQSRNPFFYRNRKPTAHRKIPFLQGNEVYSRTPRIRSVDRQLSVSESPESKLSHAVVAHTVQPVCTSDSELDLSKKQSSPVVAEQDQSSSGAVEPEQPSLLVRTGSDAGLDTHEAKRPCVLHDSYDYDELEDLPSPESFNDMQDIFEFDAIEQEQASLLVPTGSETDLDTDEAKRPYALHDSWDYDELEDLPSPESFKDVQDISDLDLSDSLANLNAAYSL